MELEIDIGSGKDKAFVGEFTSHTVLYDGSSRKLQTLNLKSGSHRLKERIMQKLDCLWGRKEDWIERQRGYFGI